MRFHHCGARLTAKLIDGKLAWYCEKCRLQVAGEVPTLMERPDPRLSQHQPIRTVLRDDQSENAPVEHECAKCGFGRAYLIVQPPVYGDEDDVIIYKCGRCGNVDREQTKVL
jgi:DNA-directed RNA polymerase subunit M/transcription elongation factor TFIIS